LSVGAACCAQRSFRRSFQQLRSSTRRAGKRVGLLRRKEEAKRIGGKRFGVLDCAANDTKSERGSRNSDIVGSRNEKVMIVLLATMLAFSSAALSAQKIEDIPWDESHIKQLRAAGKHAMFRFLDRQMDPENDMEWNDSSIVGTTRGIRRAAENMNWRCTPSLVRTLGFSPSIGRTLPGRSNLRDSLVPRTPATSGTGTKKARTLSSRTAMAYPR
jgi:hypothetical protein